MSEFQVPSPFKPGSKEDIEWQEGLAHNQAVLGSNALPGLAAQVIPYRTDDQGQTHYQPPFTGAATAFYGGMGTLIPQGLNYLAGKAGIGSRIPAAPYAEEAEKIYQETGQAARETIPAVQPTSPGEQMLANAGFSAGGMGVPLGGLIGRLPRGISDVVHAVIPTMTPTMINPVAGAVLGGGLTARENQKDDDFYRHYGLDPTDTRAALAAQQAASVDLTQPDTGTHVAHPETGAPAVVPFPIGSTQTTTAPQDPNDKGGLLYPQYNASGETDTDIGTALLYTLGGLGAGWVGLKYGSRPFNYAYRVATRTTDQLDNAANAAAHNANLDRLDTLNPVSGGGSPDASAAARGEAPLPGKAGTWGTNLAQAGWDKNRVLTELNIGTQPDKLTGERLTADIGTSNGNAAMFNRIAEQAATGVNDATGHVIPKLKSILQDVDRLSADDQKTLEDGLHTGNELDKRGIKFRQLFSGGPPADEALRHDFRDTHTSVLQMTYQKMMANPATRDIANRFYDLSKADMMEGVAQGRISFQDAQNIIRDRPRQIPAMDIDGQVGPVLRAQDTSTPGYQTPNGRAIDAIVQNYGKLYEEYANNTLNDKIIKQVVDWQNADPVRNARIFNEVPEGTPGRTITVYRQGVAHTYAVDSSSVHRAMTRGAAQTNVALNIASALRRNLQSGTTGVAATVLGRRPYGVINLIRNAGQIATDRAPGTPYGAIDRGVYAASGGRFGNRGVIPDPTAYAGAISEAIRGSGAVTARNISDILRSDVPAAWAMRRLTGENFTKALANWMEQRYTNSRAADRYSGGLGGSGAGGVADHPTFSVDISSRAGYNPLADRVPGLYHNSGAQIGPIAIPGTKGITTSYINLRTMMRDIHQEISDGANSYYYKQMMDSGRFTKNEAVYHARNVIGDPSMEGSNPIVQGFAKTMPYFNPSVQDAVRMMRNFRDNPISFVAGTVHTLVNLASAELLSAMLGGPRHMNMLGRLMAAHSRASNMTFFHDPDNEHNYTQFSLPQRWRMIYPMVQEMLAYGSGAFQARQGEDLYHRIVHSLSDVWSHHISTGTRNATIAGVSDFTDIVQLPQPAQIVLGIGGAKMQPPIGTMLENEFVKDQPLLEGLVTKSNTPTRVPGQQASHSTLSNDDNTWMRQLMSNIGGITGQAVYDDLHRFFSRMGVMPEGQTAHNIADAMDGLVGDAGQSWKDNAPFGNMIWGNNVKQAQHNPLDESVELNLDKMKNMPKASDIQLQGLTRQGGLPLLPGGDPKVASDPTVRRMLGSINTSYQQLATTLIPQRNDIKMQLHQIDNNPYYSQEDIRTMHNDATAKLNAKNEEIDRQIKLLHAALSTMAGGKHVHVGNFHADQGMDQFHD